MDSFNDVLDAAKAYCREHTADATYQYYISGLKAVSFENSNCITLEVRNDFICKIVSDRYTGLLKDAFKAVLGFDVEVKFTVPQPEPEAAKEKRPMDEASLPSGRYDFTFENFIRGPSNQFAFAAAQAVAANPSGAYNPLFIYGESGLGKTHLMHAIGNKLNKTHPEFKIMCITSENFLNSFVASIRSKQNDEFRNTFRKVDVLLVDDIQFIQDRRYTGTQMEFFHTFNDLINNTKQIILTSDTLPKNMDQMEERLKTRFSSGLVVTIDPPTPEMLQAILRTMVDNEHMKLPELNVPLEVIQFLSKMFNKRSVRDLQGAFNKLVSAAELDKRLETIDAEYTRKVLSDVLPDDEQPILSVKYIQDCVASYYQIKRESLLSQKRNKQYAVPRQVAMYLCREMISESYPQISQAFGKKDHTTALYAYEKISKKVNDDADFRRQIEDIKDKINNAI